MKEFILAEGKKKVVLRDVYETVTSTILETGEGMRVPTGEKSIDRKRVKCPLYPKRSLTLFWQLPGGIFSVEVKNTWRDGSCCAHRAFRKGKPACFTLECGATVGSGELGTGLRPPVPSLRTHRSAQPRAVLWTRRKHVFNLCLECTQVNLSKWKG